MRANIRLPKRNCTEIFADCATLIMTMRLLMQQEHDYTEIAVVNKPSRMGRNLAG